MQKKGSGNELKITRKREAVNRFEKNYNKIKENERSEENR